MGSYEVEINEVSGGGYTGRVIHLEKNGERVEIGTTSVTEMRRSVEQEAKGIAKRHSGGPEVVALDLD